MWNQELKRKNKVQKWKSLRNSGKLKKAYKVFFAQILINNWKNIVYIYFFLILFVPSELKIFNCYEIRKIVFFF
jgi:hypothetical protein